MLTCKQGACQHSQHSSTRWFDMRIQVGYDVEHLEKKPPPLICESHFSLEGVLSHLDEPEWSLSSGVCCYAQPIVTTVQTSKIPCVWSSMVFGR